MRQAAPSTAALLVGLVCNEATMTADGPVGGNALDLAARLRPRSGTAPR